MPQHDHSYKRLFSHPKMVVDLLEGFVPAAWVRDADWSTLEKVSTSYSADELHERASDVVWRVKLRGRWLYVYLLIEFQSRVERHMAVRVMTYVGLLYQDLLAGKQIDRKQPLPPVLPVVLYNGERRWRAPVDVASLVAEPPAGLEEYVPQLRYLLLDEGALVERAALPVTQNLAAALFRLEHSREPEEVVGLVHALVEWLKAPEQDGLRRAFATWLSQVLVPRRLPEVTLNATTELQEVGSMLSERVKQWEKRWKDEGREEGREQTRAEVVLQALEWRFGPLDDDLRARVVKAPASQLMEWLRRAMTADSLEDVLDS